MRPLLRFAFQQFYTRFAWTYDAVAHLVSFGEWQAWGRCAIPFLPPGGRVLEIAHGPGHLNLSLRQAGFNVVGIDRSPEMCQMLRARLARASSRSEAGDGSGLRASALRLPFADGAFDAAVSTFPAEFLFMPGTLAGVKRVLQPGGRFVIVPGTRLRGNSPLTHLVRLAYTLTGQGETPALAVAGLFASAGFAFEEHLVARPHADVIVWVCTTPFMPRRAPSGR